MSGEDPFERFKEQARGVLGVWGRFTGAVVALSLLIGAIPSLTVVAFLFTLGLPVLLLILWGRSLDQELGWSDLDEGPW